jgi:TetR/AcrR family transcriptional repressor of lmrAB and yxaGH operons
MTQNTRDQFLETTCNLLETQGYYATGLNQIVQESGAPKGSLYYYFPDGKEELAAEAVKRTGMVLADRIQTNLAAYEQPADAVRAFLMRIADLAEESDFQSGGPLSTIAMETATSSELINLSCRDAFTGMRAAFKQKLIDVGVEAEQADELAIFCLAAIEGGILLSRTYHSGKPLRQVADQMHAVIHAATG